MSQLAYADGKGRSSPLVSDLRPHVTPRASLPVCNITGQAIVAAPGEINFLWAPCVPGPREMLCTHGSISSLRGICSKG